MNFRIQPQRARPTRSAVLLRWCRYFFLVGGVLALSYCATVLLEKSLFQAYENWRFDRAMKAAQTPARGVEGPASSPLATQAEADRARAESFGIDGIAGSPLGRIEISSIGLVAMVMEGIDGKTLRRAVGHIPGTPFPGQQGNVGLAGHRDTFFRGLRNIHKGDEITMTTLHRSSHYLVDVIEVVAPENTKALAATAGDFLTLVTCYPIYYVGPAPQRFIVRAHRVPE